MYYKGKMSIFTHIQEIFSNQIVLILSEPLSDTMNTINIQNFELNGISFIPVFTSIESLKESLNGHKINNEVIKIDGLYFCSLLYGNEIITVNPDLSDEIRTTANELQDLMKDQMIKIEKNDKS